MAKKKEQPAATPIRKRFYPTLGVSAASTEEAEALTLAKSQKKDEDGDVYA